MWLPLRTARTGVPLLPAARDIAMTQIAVFDALNAVSNDGTSAVTHIFPEAKRPKHDPAITSLTKPHTAIAGYVLAILSYSL